LLVTGLSGELGSSRSKELKEETPLDGLLKTLKNEQKPFLDHMSNNVASVDLGKEVVFTDFVRRKKHQKGQS
jgi:hypothetical protein